MENEVTLSVTNLNIFIEILFMSRHANILEVERGRFHWLVSPKGPPWLALRVQKILENSCVQIARKRV